MDIECVAQLGIRLTLPSTLASASICTPAQRKVREFPKRGFFFHHTPETHNFRIVSGMSRTAKQLPAAVVFVVRYSKDGFSFEDMPATDGSDILWI